MVFMLAEIKRVFRNFSSPVSYLQISNNPIYRALDDFSRQIVDDCLEASIVQTKGQNRGTSLVKSTKHFRSNFNENYIE